MDDSWPNQMEYLHFTLKSARVLRVLTTCQNGSGVEQRTRNAQVVGSNPTFGFLVLHIVRFFVLINSKHTNHAIESSQHLLLPRLPRLDHQDSVFYPSQLIHPPYMGQNQIRVVNV